MTCRFAALVCLAAACWFNSQQAVNAATFVVQPADAYGPVSVLIKGQIQVGDFDKFRDFLLLPGRLKAYTNYVWLDSVGGNLVEAMKFANLFEKSSASVVVGPDGKCYSACFMMFASGVDRWLYAFGELGVHQVKVNFPTGLQGLDQAAKNNLTKAVTNNASAYLTAQGIPQTLVAKMQDTPASEMFIVNTLMIKREGWQRIMALQPKFLEAVEQACGKQPDPATAPWTACKIDFQTKRAKAFVAGELAQLASGQASLLFAPNKLNEAQAAVEATK
jgi:hypothetical protein